MTWEDDFADLGEFYPGSSHRIPKPEPPEEKPSASQEWDSSPRIYTVAGVDYEFFSIGDLAVALHKKSVTIRMWESAGYLPVAADLRGPSLHVGKRHRIYTRPLIEGVVRIAAEEGILGKSRPRIKSTQFKEKLIKLFAELGKLPLYGAVPLDGEL